VEGERSPTVVFGGGGGGGRLFVVVHQVEHIQYIFFPEIRLWVEGGILYSGKS